MRVFSRVEQKTLDGKFPVDRCGKFPVLSAYMDYRMQILSAFEHHCKVTGLAPATVSTQVANDGKFYERIKSGAGFTMRTYDKTMHWFKKNTPKEQSKGRRS